MKILKYCLKHSWNKKKETVGSAETWHDLRPSLCAGVDLSYAALPFSIGGVQKICSFQLQLSRQRRYHLIEHQQRFGGHVSGVTIPFFMGEV